MGGEGKAGGAVRSMLQYLGTAPVRVYVSSSILLLYPKRPDATHFRSITQRNTCTRPNYTTVPKARRCSPSPQPTMDSH